MVVDDLRGISPLLSTFALKPKERRDMITYLSDVVSEKIEHAENLYHRLVLIVGTRSTGKTRTLMEVANRTKTPLINVNLELARRLLDLTEQQRPRHVQRILEKIVVETEGNLILLDNIELLFDVALRQDPLRLLQDLSRRKIVVVAWNGFIDGNHIHYAELTHPEYVRYAMDSVLLVVNAGTTA